MGLLCAKVVILTQSGLDMVRFSELVACSNELLQIDEYEDYCPNGLQVEGREEVRRIVSGVTANQALIEAAIERQADVLLVHHGWFWRGEDSRIIGMKHRRLKALLAHDISLLAYHLPLDGHAELGNNSQLAQVFGLKIEGRFGKEPGGGIARYGSLPQAMSGTELAAHIGRCLGREPLHISGSKRPLQRLAWCSGGAQDWFEEAAALGVDGFISGEISEQTVHIARELGVDYFAAGHHATERYGVQALGEYLAQKFAISHEFVDIDNPV
jgi:dinuclear metal center YbgI/SA1388 family protein